MKIQFASDLHLEFYADKYNFNFESILTTNKEADVLILAGDIGYPEESITARFFEWCCASWPIVVWVFGNHEYYNKYSTCFTMYEKEVMAEKLCERLPNLHILKNGRLELPNLRIIGTTLWTDIPPESRFRIRQSMNDFNTIYSKKSEKMSIQLWDDLHKKMSQYIEEELYDAFNKDIKVLVVTHHLPTYKMIQPMYKTSPINAGFAAHCDDLLEHSAVAAWICGHSHGAYEIELERPNQTKVKCYLNSRGYKHETTSLQAYNPNKIIEIK
jgi:predicted phosphohydrolase